MQFLKHIIRSLWKAVIKLIEHDGVEHAGYLSFLVLFAIFPFIVFFLGVSSLFGVSDYCMEFVDYVMRNIPGEVIQKTIREIFSMPPKSLLSLAIIGSIWTASSFVEGLRTILNRIYQISSPPSYIPRRLLSIVQFLLISLFLFFAMMILVIIPVVMKGFVEIGNMIDNLSVFWNYIRYFLIFISLFISSSALYYMIPNAKIKYKDVWPGSFLTVILWLISGFLLSYYVKHYNQSLIYGSISNMIITLIFFYIVNIIFIYGAEFNYQFFKQAIFHRGKKHSK